MFIVTILIIFVIIKKRIKNIGKFNKKKTLFDHNINIYIFYLVFKKKSYQFLCAEKNYIYSTVENIKIYNGIGLKFTYMLTPTC